MSRGLGWGMNTSIIDECKLIYEDECVEIWDEEWILLLRMNVN